MAPFMHELQSSKVGIQSMHVQTLQASLYRSKCFGYTFIMVLRASSGCGKRQRMGVTAFLAPRLATFSSRSPSLLESQCPSACVCRFVITSSLRQADHPVVAPLQLPTAATAAATGFHLHLSLNDAPQAHTQPSSPCTLIRRAPPRTRTPHPCDRCDPATQKQQAGQQQQQQHRLRRPSRSRRRVAAWRRRAARRTRSSSWARSRRDRGPQRT